MTQGDPRKVGNYFLGSQLRHSTRQHLKKLWRGRTKPLMLSEDYIVGLTDGEGSFTAYIRPPDKGYEARNYRIECHYYIKLREDDLPLLKKVKQFFPCGRISFQKDNRLNHRDCYRFEVTNLKGLKEVIIPFFQQHSLQSKRIRDFNLFCNIVEAVSKKEQQSKRGLKKIQQWKSQMHK